MHYGSRILCVCQNPFGWVLGILAFVVVPSLVRADVGHPAQRKPVIAMLELEARNVNPSLKHRVEQAVRDQLIKTLESHAEVLTLEEQTAREQDAGVDGAQPCNSISCETMRDQLTRTLESYTQALTLEEQTTQEQGSGVEEAQLCNIISCEMEQLQKIRADFGIAGDVTKTGDDHYVVYLRAYDLKSAKLLGHQEVATPEVAFIRRKVELATETLCNALPVWNYLSSSPSTSSELVTESPKNRNQANNATSNDVRFITAKIASLESKTQRFQQYADVADSDTLLWALGGVSVPLGTCAVCCALGVPFASPVGIVGALGLLGFESIVLAAIVEEQKTSQAYRRKAERAKKQANKLRTQLKEARKTESVDF